MSMRNQFAFLWTFFFLCLAAAAQHSPSQRALVTLRELVPSNDKLAEHDLSFQTSLARQAIEYLGANDPRLMEQMADSPAITHILNHAQIFNNNDVQKESRTALLNSLLGPWNTRAKRSATCARSLDYVSGPMLSDPHWVNDALAYLPTDFRFHGSLFLTFGYDIGSNKKHVFRRTPLVSGRSLYGATNRGIERAGCFRCFGKTGFGKVLSNLQVSGLAPDFALMPARMTCWRFATNI